MSQNDRLTRELVDVMKPMISDLRCLTEMVVLICCLFAIDRIRHGLYRLVSP